MPVVADFKRQPDLGPGFRRQTGRSRIGAHVLAEAPATRLGKGAQDGIRGALERSELAVASAARVAGEITRQAEVDRVARKMRVRLARLEVDDDRGLHEPGVGEDASPARTRTRGSSAGRRDARSTPARRSRRGRRGPRAGRLPSLSVRGLAAACDRRRAGEYQDGGRELAAQRDHREGSTSVRGRVSARRRESGKTSALAEVSERGAPYPPPVDRTIARVGLVPTQPGRRCRRGRTPGPAPRCFRPRRRTAERTSTRSRSATQTTDPVPR
jgi:hypothetical protein